jgi:hypothetical protein
VFVVGPTNTTVRLDGGKNESEVLAIGDFLVGTPAPVPAEHKHSILERAKHTLQGFHPPAPRMPNRRILNLPFS